MSEATSYSDIDTYMRCAKKYWFRVVNNLQRKERNLNLTLGDAIHQMLRDFFLALRDNDEPEHSVERTWQRLLEEMEVYLFEDEMVNAPDLLNEAARIVGFYVSKVDFSNWEILHVEEEFIITLDTGAVVSFTPDLVVRDPSGSVWVVDHKSTSRMPSDGVPFGDLQAMLYLVGVSALYPETAGFIYNRLRKKEPTAPRLTTTGDKRVANLNRIDTTYEVLFQFLTDEAPDLLDDLKHRQRLAELRDSDGRWFWSEQIYKNEHAMSTILDEVASTIKTMGKDETFARHLVEDNGWNSCSKCPFVRVCQADLLGWNTEQVLAEDYEIRDKKNPYQEAV